jgi:AcrR family transcriptional regulator
MATESTGDPARSMALLWRTPPGSDRRPGPKPSLDVDRIVSAAVQLADAEGLAAVSMRRVAGDLGVATMNLYSHVPGKGELVDLMLDAVLGELYADEAVVTAGSWRARLETVARANWAAFRRHPWALHLATGRPPLGPHLLRKYELELRAVDGLGLSEVQMDLLVSLLNGFVRGTMSDGHGRATTEQGAGMTEGRWWTAMAPHAERFPTVARVGPVAGNDLQGASAPERSFEFGLERLLDGVGVLILNPSR